MSWSFQTAAPVKNSRRLQFYLVRVANSENNWLTESITVSPPLSSLHSAHQFSNCPHRRLPDPRDPATCRVNFVVSPTNMHCIITLLALTCMNLFAVDSLKLADEIPKDFPRGGFQLTGNWEGYMGIALYFKNDGTCKYWFYSDAKFDKEIEYPVEGRYEIKGSKIAVHFLDASIPVEIFYVYKADNDYVLFPENAHLWVQMEGRKDLTRILFHNDGFNQDKPWEGRISVKQLP